MSHPRPGDGDQVAQHAGPETLVRGQDAGGKLVLLACRLAREQVGEENLLNKIFKNIFETNNNNRWDVPEGGFVSVAEQAKLQITEETKQHKKKRVAEASKFFHGEHQDRPKFDSGPGLPDVKVKNKKTFFVRFFFK